MSPEENGVLSTAELLLADCSGLRKPGLRPVVLHRRPGGLEEPSHLLPLKGAGSSFVGDLCLVALCCLITLVCVR